MQERPHSNAVSKLGLPFPCGCRILIVDDFEDTAEMLTTLLTLSGNECFTAFSGSEGLAAARFHRPEIILLDINMPVMDGFKTCELIREEPWSKHVKIIAFTGNCEVLHLIAAHKGFDACLVKPIDPEELSTVLQELE